MPRLLVSVTEGRRFILPAEVDTSGVRERIVRYTSGYPFEVVTIDRKGLRAGNVVGAIDFGSWQLEILPKTSASSTSAADAAFLLNLLTASGLISRSIRLPGRVRHVSGTIVEPVIASFATRILKELSNGAPRRYSPREELSAVVRGRIDFSALGHRLPGRDHLLPVRIAPLHSSNALSQLVRAVVEYLLTATQSTRSRAVLLASLRLLSDVPAKPLTAEMVGRIHLSSLESHWQDIVELAEVLVRGRTLDPTSIGYSNLFNMVFSLDDLFERILRRELRYALSETALVLANQGRRLNLLHSVDTGVTSLALKPDFLFHSRDETAVPILVGDAKWKLLEETSRSFGLVPSDVYQIATYMASYSLPVGILFFPRVSWMSSSWAHTFRIAGRSSLLHLIAVDVPGLVSPSTDLRARAVLHLRQATQNAVATLGALPFRPLAHP